MKDSSLKMSEKTRIVITLIASIAETAVFLLLKNSAGWSFFENAIHSLGIASEDIINVLSMLTPAGLLFLLNYYLLSPLIYRFETYLLSLFGAPKFFTARFSELERRCLNFLVGCDVRWGTCCNDTEVQNANLCEGLLALIKTSSRERYRSVCDEALNGLKNVFSEKGLASKSLERETTVCSGMACCILSQLKESSPQLSGCLDTIWSARSDTGWGLYLKQHGHDTTRLSPSFWALRALVSAGYNADGFAQYLVSFYERAADSLFGYTFSDRSRLCASSMFLVLFYELDDELRERVRAVYDPRAAAAFIAASVISGERYTEIEQITGANEVDKVNVKSVPWVHISIGYALEALGLARENGDLSRTAALSVANALISEADKYIIALPEQNKSFFSSDALEAGSRGAFTFPTAYFVSGLHIFAQHCFTNKSGRV